jgi:hypothetical protein
MLQDRLQRVEDRIAAACEKAGRSRDAVQLLAVTKNHSVETVNQAIDAGLRLFGENRVQEAVAKYQSIGADVELHLIGHLQSNKARDIPGVFRCVESVDSLKLARALSTRCVAADEQVDVYLQLNSSGEESKSGFTDTSELVEAADAIRELDGIALRGVMTIGPFTDDPAPIVKAFAKTRMVFENLRGRFPSENITVLSMGMTDDLEIAIGEGSTEVRIGTAIFGGRT